MIQLVSVALNVIAGDNGPVASNAEVPSALMLKTAATPPPRLLPETWPL
jgi:hypothetical protein